MDNKQYKLSQIVQIINRTFDEVFGESEFLFTAEIMKLSTIAGKIYMELVEFETNGKTAAKSRAIIYEKSIYNDFVEVTKIENLSDLKWLSLLFTWKITFHPEYGFSIKITKIHSEYVLGQIVKKEQSILDQLTKEWIVNKNKSTQIGNPPFHIAIISSETSQWFEDFRSIIDNSIYHISYTLYPTYIHGNQAILSVYNSLKEIYLNLKSGINYNMVGIVRGWWGGSGIIWQNDMNIARWICHMPVPVMLAVWHTTDQFVLDKIAKYAMKTPSDAAWFIIDQMDSLTKDIESIYTDICRTIDNRKSLYIYQIDALYHQIWHIINSRKNQIIANIDIYYNGIKMLDLGYMTARGFALVQSDGKYISRQDVLNLKKWDELSINIYDYEFDVVVK